MWRVRPPTASDLHRGDPCRVRPGSPYAGIHGQVYTVLEDGSHKPVVVLLERVEGSKYYAVEELEFPFQIVED